VIKGTSKPRREGFGREQSERIKQWYADHPEQREIRRISMSANWRNGAIVKNGYSCNRSKIEADFYSKMQEVYPHISRNTIRLQDSWAFPDVVVGEDGIVVELYGDFWHANPDRYQPDDVVMNGLMARDIWQKDRRRREALEKEGYNVIVIWEREYKQCPELVLNRMDALLNWEGCAL